MVGGIEPCLTDPAIERIEVSPRRTPGGRTAGELEEDVVKRLSELSLADRHSCVFAIGHSVL